MLNLGTITATLTASAAGFISAFAQADRAVASLSTAVVAVGAAATAAFAGAVGEGLRFAASLEQLQIGFTTMLGSAEEAASFLREMQTFAATTPFQFEDVAKGAQRLMAMGFAAENVIPLLSAIGDRVAAMGGGAPEVQRVITALGQMNAKTKVATGELNQLTEVGIGGMRLLAAHLGQDVVETQRQVEARLIDSATFLEAFMQSTSAEMGGMMAAQSETLLGLLSTLQDTMSVKLADAAQPMIAPLKQAIPEVTKFADTVIATISPMISGLGAAATAVRDLLIAFNALGPQAQRAILLGVAALPALAGAVVLGMEIASAIGTIIGAVGALGGALATVLAPEVALPIIAVFGTLAAMAALATAALSEVGETPLQTLQRLGSVVGGALLEGMRQLQVYAEAAAAGFLAGFGPIGGLFDALTTQVRGLLDQAAQLIALLVGAGDGWQVWYGLAAILGVIARYLGTVLVSALQDAIRMGRGLLAIFGPLVASVIEFGRGLLGLVTGSMTVGDAFKAMGVGLLGVLSAVLVGAVNLFMVAVAQIASKLAVLVDAIPGAAGRGLSQILNGMADGMTAAASGIAQKFTDTLSAARGATVGITFDFEADAAGAPLAGFNMELETVTPALGDYANALTGATNAAADAARGSAAVRTATDTTDTTAQSDAARWAAAAQARAAEEALRPLKDGLKGMTPKEIGAEAGPLARAFMALRAAIAPAEQGIKDLGADLPRIGDQLRSALGALADGLAAETGNFGALLSATVEGAKTGGAAGAAVGAGLSLLGMSKSMDSLVGQLDEMLVEMVGALDPLIAGIGMVLLPAVQLVGGLLSALSGVFGFIGQVLSFLGPVLFAVGGLFAALGGLLSVVMGILEPIMPLVEFAFRLLYEAMRAVALIVLGIVYGIQSAWNAILGVVADLLRMVGAKKAAAGVEAMMADTASTSAAMETLASTTWDAAYAQIENTTATMMAADAADALTDALTNVPNFYKVAQTAWGAATAQMGGRVPAFASGGMVTGPTLALIGEAGPEAVVPLRQRGDISAFAGIDGRGRGTTVVIESMTVSAPDPARFLRALERIAERRSVVTRGTPLPAAGRYGGE